MPTFELTGPDGGTYQLEAASAAEAVSAFNGAFAKPEAESSIAGVGKSLATGVAEGAVGLAGLPGDIYHLGLRALGDNLTPESRFGSNAIKKSVEGYTGEFYKPQGAIEETANKVGQFLPAAIGGPETLAAKIGTRVLAPAVTSQVAGMAAPDGMKPYAEAAGALGGAVGATSALRSVQAAQRAKSAVPAAEDIIRTAKGQFKSAEDMNLTVTPDWASGAAAKMRSDLKGFDPEAQGVVFKAADRLEGLGVPKPGTPFVPVEMNEVELIRKQLSTLKTSPDASVREAARRAISSLQDSQTSVVPAQVLRGDAQAYSSTMKEAIANYATGKRSNTVMGKAALGDLNAATAGSGANEDNALRQAVKQLVRPVNNDIVPKASRLGFNAEEIAAMNKVARGTATGNAARYLGKLAPTGSVSAVLGAGAGYGAAGPAGAVALPVVGYIAKKIGDMSTKRGVAALGQLVRSRSPLAQQVAAQLPPAVVAKLPSRTKLMLASSSMSPVSQLVPQGRQQER